MSRSKSVTLAIGLASALVIAFSQVTLGAHAIRVQGSGTVYDGTSLDLDNGNFSASKTARELKFVEFGPEARYLDTAGLTTIARMDLKPGYQACKGAVMGRYTFNVEFIDPGAWFCVKTKQGRYARFHIEQIYAYPNGFVINYTTWA